MNLVPWISGPPIDGRPDRQVRASVAVIIGYDPKKRPTYSTQSWPRPMKDYIINV